MPRARSKRLMTLSPPLRHNEASKQHQNWARTPISIFRGLVALVLRPKFGDVITPDGGPKFVRLKALVRLTKTLTFRRVAPGAGPERKNAFDTFASTFRTFGRLPLLRGTPAGRSVTLPSRLLSSPVVML